MRNNSANRSEETKLKKSMWLKKKRMISKWCLSLFTPKGTKNENPISVEKHCEYRDIILAYIASSTSKSRKITSVDDDDDEIRVSYSTTKNPNPTTKFEDEKNPFGNSSITEVGESSSSNTTQGSSNSNSNPLILCEICVEPMPVTDLFPIKGCSHRYCKDCISKYVESKLQNNISNINCPVPECNGKVEPEECQSILPPQVFDRWGNALCEALILDSQKYYCPFKDCSALLVNDCREVITQSECPYCRRLFCAQCNVGWHVDMGCDEFQKLGENEREDIMLMKLAKSEKWQRCSRCNFFVQRSEGCQHIVCRCGYQFCYNCGSRWARYRCRCYTMIGM